MVIWVAVGGRGTLFGAIFGAIGVNIAKSYFTVAFPEIWLFFLGALFVFVTVFLPRGVVGLLDFKRSGRELMGGFKKPGQRMREALSPKTGGSDE